MWSTDIPTIDSNTHHYIAHAQRFQCGNTGGETIWVPHLPVFVQALLAPASTDLDIGLFSTPGRWGKLSVASYLRVSSLNLCFECVDKLTKSEYEF